MLKEKYKQQRHNDDENQPLSVQPWGVDGDKRRYFLVQGLDDTSFRVYREGSRHTRNAHWYNQAGTIDEVKALAKKLEEVDGTQAARRLAGKMSAAIPTFEATEEVSLNRKMRQDGQVLTTGPETPPPRVPERTASAFHTSGARVLPLRRSHARKTHALHVRR